MRSFLTLSIATFACVGTSCPHRELLTGPAEVLFLTKAVAPTSASLTTRAAVAEPEPIAEAERESPTDLDEVEADDGTADWGVEPVVPDTEALLDVPEAPEPLDRAKEKDGAIVDPASPRLASIARETWIYAEPRFRSRRLGYLRAGAVVGRSEKAVASKGCKTGWYAIEPVGYVCAEKTATLDVFSPVVEASTRRPNREGLPYDYVMSRFPTPPLYARLPTADEQKRAEPDLASHQRKLGNLARDKDYVEPPPPQAIPNALVYGRPLPTFGGEPERSEDRFLIGQARTRSGFALLSQFDHEGRRFGLTTDLFVVPIDRTRFVKPTTFHGVALDDELTLPIAFVMKKHATRFTMDDGGKLTPGETLGYRDALPLTGDSSRGGAYLALKDGSWVRAEDVRRIDPMTRPPAWSSKDRKWVDVSILKQSLVAYEGRRPVYVTLVSTGADGLGDPKKTHSTVQGTFLIHTKHVSVTMDADEEEGDPFDLREVPFVQYFTEGYALHAAYWHDDFGTPRSHGCVNLAPKDAAWLFGFTTPDVPATWHAAMSLRKGTLVHTHP